MTIRIYDNSIGEYDNYKKLGYLRMSRDIVSRGLQPEDVAKCGRCSKPILASYGFKPKDLISICGTCINEEYKALAAEERAQKEAEKTQAIERKQAERMYERLFKGRY